MKWLTAILARLRRRPRLDLARLLAPLAAQPHWLQREVELAADTSDDTLAKLDAVLGHLVRLHKIMDEMQDRQDRMHARLCALEGKR